MIPIDNSGVAELDKSDILDIISDESTDDIEQEVVEEVSKKVVEKEEEDLEEDESEEGKKKEDKIELVDKEDEDDEEEDKKEVDDEELEIIAPARRKEILKKYPNVFKDFPHLERSYYRDQKYTEMFGTPQEAEQVVRVAQNYNHFAQSLGKGTTEEVLKVVKNENPEAFERIVDSYLTTLRDVDEKAFYHVVGNTIKSTVAAMVQEAQSSNNQDLLTAAQLLHQFVMGTSNWQGINSFSKQRPKEEVQQESELNRERWNFFRERFETTQTDLQSRVDNVLRNTIDQNIDPKGSMTDYVKKVAVQEAFSNTQKAIRADNQFVRLLDKLWERAAQDKFSKNSTDKIRSAYLAKAKSLLPEQIKTSRNAALRGLGKRVREESNEESMKGIREVKSSGKASPPATYRGNNGKQNPSTGKRTLDFLNED